MDADTTGLVISSGAIGALCGVASTWIKAKFGQRTRIEPNPSPFPVQNEQTSNQAHWKDNSHDHENLFNRMSKVEKDVARIEAKTDATFQFIQRQLDQLTNMTTQLFEKIIGKARK